jgi:hypothetical protein
MIPTRSQSSSKKRNDHVLSGPSKTWRPALQSLIRRPPNNNVQRPRLERSRSRKFLFTNAWKRQVCHIAALLESVCRIRHHCAMCWPLHKSVSLATTGHSSQADIHQGLHSIGDQYPGHTTNDIFGISSQIYSIYSISRMSDGHKSQLGNAYTRHCLRSSRVRLIRSRGRSRPASTVPG